MKTTSHYLLFVCALLNLFPLQSSLASEQIQSYALVVGNHRPGSGQNELKYAGDDAISISTVLTEMGGYNPENVELIFDPSSEELAFQLEAFSEILETHHQKDEKTVFLFYYSGHARAQSLTLGKEEFPLIELRNQLEALPSTVTLVILDACQTGSISQIKGVEPATDFSYNSVAGLQTKGMAVLASSSATEFSQESEELSGSYFTHHLVVGLRGAADSDLDGRVSLAEAHHYAYHRTLISTSRTAIGQQHVTLETEMQGKGEMILTYPAETNTTLTLPDHMDSEVLVHTQPNQSVIAEVHKVSGNPLYLALAPGEYKALVRTGDELQSCTFALLGNQNMELNMDNCEPVLMDKVELKGNQPKNYQVWSMDTAFGATVQRSDAYIDRLSDFGFEATGDNSIDIAYQFSIGFNFNRYLSLHLQFGRLGGQDYNRNISNRSDEGDFKWNAHRITLGIKGSMPLFRDKIIPYVLLSGGLSIGNTEFSIPSEATDEETFVDYIISAAAGIQFMPWKHFGFYVQAEYAKAPAIKNQIDEVHDSGGIIIMNGFRVAF